MREACVLLKVIVLSLFATYTAVKGDAGGHVCSWLDGGALSTLTGKGLPTLVCHEEESAHCCPYIKEQPPKCKDWDVSVLMLIRSSYRNIPVYNCVTDVGCPHRAPVPYEIMVLYT